MERVEVFKPRREVALPTRYAELERLVEASLEGQQLCTLFVGTNPFSPAAEIFAGRVGKQEKIEAFSVSPEAMTRLIYLQFYPNPKYEKIIKPAEKRVGTIKERGHHALIHGNTNTVELKKDGYSYLVSSGEGKEIKVYLGNLTHMEAIGYLMDAGLPYKKALGYVRDFGCGPEALMPLAAGDINGCEKIAKAKARRLHEVLPKAPHAWVMLGKATSYASRKERQIAKTALDPLAPKYGCCAKMHEGKIYEPEPDNEGILSLVNMGIAYIHKEPDGKRVCWLPNKIGEYCNEVIIKGKKRGK